MNERLVEDWLTKASERSFQTPFAQSLLADGMQVLRVGHSPHEHGKDIIALDQQGKVHAYQLKEGDLDLKQFEQGFAQVTALVETQVEHPALTGKPKHQPWLVVSGNASIPVEDRIRVHNERWRQRQFTPLKLITGMPMLARFTKMAENFWPQKPEESRSLLSLYLADGRGVLDRGAFAKLIAGVVGTTGSPPRPKSDADSQQQTCSPAMPSRLFTQPPIIGRLFKAGRSPQLTSLGPPTKRNLMRNPGGQLFVSLSMLLWPPSTLSLSKRLHQKRWVLARFANSTKLHVVVARSAQALSPRNSFFLGKRVKYGNWKRRPSSVYFYGTGDMSAATSKLDVLNRHRSQTV